MPTPRTPIVDTHCHLDDERFAGDLDAVLDRMRVVGVVAAVSIGTDLASSRFAVGLAERHADLYASAAIHPSEAGKAVPDADWAALEALTRHPRVVAVGETGLDWHRDYAPREAQRAHYDRFIALARAAGKPLVVHCRDAYPDCLAQLRAAWPPPCRGVFHCFSGTVEHARAALDLGMHISIAAPVGYPRSHALRDVARRVPADRLLVETDAPWLPPQSRRGRRNEPAYVAETAAALAAARGMTPAAVAETTTKNAQDLFGIRL
jgi:TatD DNase family protein